MPVYLLHVLIMYKAVYTLPHAPPPLPQHMTSSEFILVTIHIKV